MNYRKFAVSCLGHFHSEKNSNFKVYDRFFIFPRNTAQTFYNDYFYQYANDACENFENNIAHPVCGEKHMTECEIVAWLNYRDVKILSNVFSCSGSVLGFAFVPSLPLLCAEYLNLL